MFQDYYKAKAQAYSKELERFNERYLSELNSFHDAVKKYKKLEQLYYKTAKYIKKIPYSRIDSEGSLYNQIEQNLNRLYNSSIIDALKMSSEKEVLHELQNIKADLNSSYGYGFDSYITKYEKQITSVIEKYKIIYKNYNNQKKSTTTNINILKESEPMYKEILEFCKENGKVSASLLQRKFLFGYNRAAYIIDKLEESGIIGPSNGTKAREVLSNIADTNSVSKVLIDFVGKYGVDYEQKDLERRKFIDNYPNNAQTIFDERGLDIKFNNHKRIDLSKLKSLLFTNTEQTDVNKLVNKILESSVPNDVKLVLIDYSQINLLEYNGLPNLKLPVIHRHDMSKQVISNLISEMNMRYNLFIENKVKNINSYNNKMDIYNKMPYIILVINELFELLKIDNMRELISELLLNCINAGIIVIGFSKFNKKNIQLFMLEDLFEVHNNYSDDYIDYDRIESNSNIEYIDNDMDGFDFEKYAGKLLLANGFQKVEVTQCSNDFGVDIIAYKDDIKYAIQCKKYSSSVGIKAVQEVIGSVSMNACHVGVVLTNSTFTKSAIELAEKNNILLWDRNKLIELIGIMNS